MNGDQIIQRMAARIANLIVEVEMLRQENIELLQKEVKPDGINSNT